MHGFDLPTALFRRMLPQFGKLRQSEERHTRGMVHGASTKNTSVYFVRLREDAYNHESPEASNKHGIRSPVEIEHFLHLGTPSASHVHATAVKKSRRRN